MGLKSLYANVASTVESVAKDSGYKIDLGSKAVASSLEQQRFEQQMRANGGYQGFGSDSYGSGHAASGGYSSSGHGHGVHKSASAGAGLGGQHGYNSSQQHGAGGYAGGSTAAKSNGNFGGFDDGADGWDDWSATVKPVAGGSKVGGSPAPKAAAAAAGGMGSNVAKQHSLSSPALHNKDEDDWGKW